MGQDSVTLVDAAALAARALVVQAAESLQRLN
jgi:hypothetical protein